MDLTLREVLSVLSKASPFSVKTDSQKPHDNLDDAKAWLYVEQDIETEFRKILTFLAPGNIVFLCGSSGDGKSEILTRCQKQYQDVYTFHLDATHSFAPHQSAIEALDERFTRSVSDQRPLVVGINIGMLANYAKEGASEHAALREEIDTFLRKEHVQGRCQFLDFEDFPKFHFALDGASSNSKFAKKLMQRLTEASNENPFHALALSDANKKRDPLLLSNFNLLALDEVQDAIITCLFKVRLIKDQFITARSLLDFIHHLLLGDGGLADNMFSGSDNELVMRMSDFDPVLRHTHKLDQFVLLHGLQLPNPELGAFLAQLHIDRLLGPLSNAMELSAASLLRLFYLLRDLSIGNNFHEAFKEDFQEKLLAEYEKVWMLHLNYQKHGGDKLGLRPFYTDELIEAVYRHANRNSPLRGKGEIFLGKSGALQLSAPIDITADFPSIRSQSLTSVSRFSACLRVENVSLKPVPINLNFFELILKLNRGYRPNKYDKNSVVMLDELVEQVRDQAKKSSKLNFYEDGKCYTAKQDDDMISISGAI